MVKRKWLLILLAVLILIGGCAAAFWDTIVIYVAPKSVLSQALYEAMTDLQSRYDQSPVSLLAGHVDPQGLYTAYMELDTENELLGPVSYDMTVFADTVKNRFSAEGVVATSQNDLDLSVYLDRNFMALSSEDLLSGAYYGITYETFPEDIRSIPLISMFVGESILTGWDTSVAQIQEMMNQQYRIPQMPKISTEDIQRAMSTVLLLPSKVEQAEMTFLGVKDLGHKVTYTAKGEQVGQLLSYLMEIRDGSDAMITASFYLYERQLVMMHLNGEVGGNSIQFAMEFKVEGATESLRYSLVESGKEQEFCLRHKGQRANGYLTEEWTFYPNFEAEGEGKELRYRWEPVMGEMVLYLQPSVTMSLFETEAGLNIQMDHLEWLLDAVSGAEPDWEAEAVSCKLILQSGTKITTPVYKNIRDWSLEDLLVLLGGVGSLFGLKV